MSPDILHFSDASSEAGWSVVTVLRRERGPKNAARLRHGAECRPETGPGTRATDSSPQPSVRHATGGH